MADIWSLVTGAASILSLLLALAEKFSTWRKYAIPLAGVLAGFTLGRLTASLQSASDHSSNDLTVAIVIILFVSLLGALSLKLVHNKEYSYAYIIFILGIILGLPKITESLRQLDSGFKFDDALEFAVTKESEGNLSKAETYYRMAAKLASSDETRKPILGKADELHKKRTETLLGRKTNGADGR